MAHFVLLLCAILSLAFPASAAQQWDGWPFTWFRTGHWQPPHIVLRQIGRNQDPGKIFLSVRNDNLEDGTAPTIYDNNGDMVWQGPHEKTMDFKMQKLFGKDVITYWDGETGVLGYGYGQVHILDDTYKEIYTVTLQDDFVTPNGVPRESYVDVHEHIITPNNTMIVSAINITTTDCSDVPDGREDMYVIDALFYEIDIATNEVLFKWDALEHPDKIQMGMIKQTVWGGDSPEHPWDCFHMNSVHPTKDGYLVSIRYLWSALYINRDGSVRWQLSVSYTSFSSKTQLIQNRAPKKTKATSKAPTSNSHGNTTPACTPKQTTTSSSPSSTTPPPASQKTIKRKASSSTSTPRTWSPNRSTSSPTQKTPASPAPKAACSSSANQARATW